MFLRGRTYSHKNEVRLARPEAQAEFVEQLPQLIAPLLHLRYVFAHERLVGSASSRQANATAFTLNGKLNRRRYPICSAAPVSTPRTQAGESIGFGERARDEQIGMASQIPEAVSGKSAPGRKTRNRPRRSARPHGAPLPQFQQVRREAARPVGLLGFAMAITRVRGEIRANRLRLREAPYLRPIARAPRSPLAPRRASDTSRTWGRQRAVRRPAEMLVNSSDSASSIPLVSSTCSDGMPRKFATSRSPGLALRIEREFAAESERSRACTRGEHPAMLSLRSRLSPSRLTMGERYGDSDRQSMGAASA
jgi:hypothetical protein